MGGSESLEKHQVGCSHISVGQNGTPRGPCRAEVPSCETHRDTPSEPRPGTMGGFPRNRWFGHKQARPFSSPCPQRLPVQGQASWKPKNIIQEEKLFRAFRRGGTDRTSTYFRSPSSNALPLLLLTEVSPLCLPSNSFLLIIP